MMARYYYAWTPIVLVGAVVWLSSPGLGVIALVVVALFALVVLATLAWAIAAAPLAVARAVGRQWRERGAVSQPRAALSFIERENPYPTTGERRSGGVR